MQLNQKEKLTLENYIKDNIDQLNDVLAIKEMIASTTEMMVIDQLENNAYSLNDVLASLDIIQVRNKVLGDRALQIEDSLQLKEINSKTLQQLTKTKRPTHKISVWRFIWASLVMIPWWIIGIFFVFGAISVATIGMGAFFLPVYGGFSFAIYDLGAAFALFFFLLGMAPIIMFICYWLFAILWEVIKVWIDLSARTYNKESSIPLVLERINFIKTAKKANKKALAIFGIIFGVIFAGGISGTFADKNGVMGAVARNRYVYTQELTFDVVEEAKKAAQEAGNQQEIKAGTVKTIIFQNIWAHQNIPTDDLLKTFEPTKTEDNNLVKINFSYNTKQKTEKIKPSYAYQSNNAGGDGDNGVLIVKFSYPNIEPMMNVKGYGWTINVASALAGTNISTYIIYK